jgi:potassium inwardly-rectifying channel subfamily J
MFELKNLASKYLRSEESVKFDQDVYVRKRPRLIEKCGELNIKLGHVKKRRRRLLNDIFTTALDIGWLWHVLIYLLIFFLSWVAFGILWYALAYYRGDMLLDDSNLNHTLITNLKRPCVVGMTDFTSALLFSIETQNTIGYGSRHITEECHIGIVILMFQSYFGILLQGLVTGVVFAKISIPNKRKKTIVFSRNAVISRRDGKLCFMFKIGNIRESQLSDTRVRILMIKSRHTLEGKLTQLIDTIF